MKTAAPTKPETALCRRFQDYAALDDEIEIHPESHGWDLILKHEGGGRLGIQAKANPYEVMLAVTQCVERLSEGNVDAASILVPTMNEAARRLCRKFGLGWIVPFGDGFKVVKPEPKEATPLKARKRLPRHSSNRAAGTPSPRSLSPQVERELVLLGIIRARGFAVSADLKRVGIDRRWWRPRWIRFTKGAYYLVEGVEAPDELEEWLDVAPKYAREGREMVRL